MHGTQPGAPGVGDFLAASIVFAGMTAVARMPARIVDGTGDDGGEE